MKKIFFSFFILLIGLVIVINTINSSGQAVRADFYIESVEEVKAEIKTYEDDKVIIQVELPQDIEIKAEPLEAKDQKTFYDVWFEKDGETIDYNALIHVEFKGLTFESGKIVKIENDVETDVTDLESEEKLQSIWFSAGEN